MAKAILEVFLGAKTDQFRKEIEQAKRTVNELRDQVGALAPTLGSAFTVAGISALGYEAVKTGAEIYDMSRRLGLSVESTQRLSYASKITGTDIEMLAKATLKAQSALATGASPAMMKGLELLNLKVKDLQGLTPEQFLIRLGDAFASVKDRGEANAGVVELLGSRYTALIPLLERGGVEMKKMFGEANVLSDESVKRMKALSDQLERQKPLWLEIGVGVATVAKYVFNAIMGIETLVATFGKLNIDAFSDIIHGRNPFETLKKSLGYFKNDLQHIWDGFKTPDMPTGAGKFGNTGVDPEIVKAQKEAERERLHIVKEIESIEKEIARIRQETAEIGMTEAEKRKELEKIIADSEVKKRQIEIATNFVGMTPEETKKAKAEVESIHERRTVLETIIAHEPNKAIDIDANKSAQVAPVAQQQQPATSQIPIPEPVNASPEELDRWAISEQKRQKMVDQERDDFHVRRPLAPIDARESDPDYAEDQIETRASHDSEILRRPDHNTVDYVDAKNEMERFRIGLDALGRELVEDKGKFQVRDKIAVAPSPTVPEVPTVKIPVSDTQASQVEDARKKLAELNSQYADLAKVRREFAGKSPAEIESAVVEVRKKLKGKSPIEIEEAEEKVRKELAPKSPEEIKKAEDSLALEAVKAKKKLAELDKKDSTKSEEHQKRLMQLNDELADKQEKLDFSHLTNAEKINALKQKELDLLNEADKAFGSGDAEKGVKLKIKAVDVIKELEDLENQKPAHAETHVYGNAIRQMGGVGADTRAVTSGISPVNLQQTANKHLENMVTKLAKLDKLDKIEANTRKGAGWQ